MCLFTIQTKIISAHQLVNSPDLVAISALAADDHRRLGPILVALHEFLEQLLPILLDRRVVNSLDKNTVGHSVNERLL